LTDDEAGETMMKHMQQTSVKVRRKFDETFKRESVQHWLEGSEKWIMQNYQWGRRFYTDPAASRKILTRFNSCRLHQDVRGNLCGWMCGVVFALFHGFRHFSENAGG
jgi:hypothetical protein